MSNTNLPDKFRIPADRIPKAWSQGPYDCCVMASFVKVLEVINYVKTGEYTMLSKGYAYGRHSNPNFKSFKSGGGGDFDYTMKSILERGSVPEEMYPHMNEIPNIMFDVESAPNLAELDEIAEKTKAENTIKIPGNAFFKDVVKKYLYENWIPLPGNMAGQHHSTVIVGWDEDGFEFCDHDGRVDEETGRSYVYGGGKFNEACYIDGGIEDKEENDMKDKFMNIDGFSEYISALKVTRAISRVQLHHTYSPSYAQFTGDNHASLQNGMRSHHTKTNGWTDIGQHFTIFPDGKIMTGRDINTSPAGIKGANTGAICIECLGNFDIGGDIMTNAQRNSIIGVVKMLLDKFGLNAESGVTYHAWWSADGKSFGDYYKNSSAKTCPGTNFFGGNTRSAYRNNLMPLIKNYGKVETTPMLETANDITWELNHTYFPIDDMASFVKVLDAAKKNNSPLYWGYYKLVNRIK